MRCSAYLTNVFNRLDDVVNWNVEQLLPHLDKFDAIAFRGMSGAMVAPAVALRLRKPFILVRKPGEGSHSEYRVEGATDVSRYVIIDDLVASGGTVRTIQQEIKSVNPQAVCVGIALWFGHDIYWRAVVEKERTWESRYFEDFCYPERSYKLTDDTCVAVQKNATQVLEETASFTATQCNEAVEWYRARIGGGYAGVDLAAGPDTQVKVIGAYPGDVRPIIFKRPSSLAQSFAQFAQLEAGLTEADAKAMGVWKEITGQDLTAEANTAVGPGGGPEKQ